MYRDVDLVDPQVHDVQLLSGPGPGVSGA
ncbi:hypothetical protein SHJG_p1114 (plasmid) [Streptomyces hygroscopicus subsp. jinggangensis 5008]|nr:hypothetical protein SHJG_p1114 [Streptomyces hygroscopicus subsp. jinggangensis 5008]AGF68399.1 hypothetical protein SHJGH_p1114 [Streptomyces hygroscopicus subsp. jinggangensis TL01]